MIIDHRARFAGAELAQAEAEIARTLSTAQLAQFYFREISTEEVEQCVVECQSFSDWLEMARKFSHKFVRTSPININRSIAVG